MDRGLFANLFTSVAIQKENATVVSLIEISYPFFVMGTNFRVSTFILFLPKFLCPGLLPL